MFVVSLSQISSRSHLFLSSLQAIDRCVRIGQERAVTVVRLFISSSIEDRMREIQAQKQRVTDGVLNEDSQKVVCLICLID
jgi:SNF2 family DNA or RNA helicase